MDIRIKCYPYPVLAYYSDDYVSSSFDSSIKVEKAGYDVKVSFETILNCNELSGLISNGKAQYIYHLECSQTGYREVVAGNKVIVIDRKRICGELHICTFIVAVTNIDGYSSKDFHEDYAGLSFDIEAGCVLAIGQHTKVYIDKDIEDFSETPSIFSVIGNSDETSKEMLVDYSDTHKIIIQLPMLDWYSYKQLYRIPAAQAVVNAIVVVPALSYVLSFISKISIQDRLELQSNSWYRALKKVLNDKFSCNIESETFAEENTLVLAQKLIDYPGCEAFRALSNGFGDCGGDD